MVTERPSRAVAVVIPFPSFFFLRPFSPGFRNVSAVLGVVVAAWSLLCHGHCQFVNEFFNEFVYEFVNEKPLSCHE